MLLLCSKVYCLYPFQHQWAAAMTLRTVLLSLQALLASPEPDDPQDAVVARQCKEKPQIFQLTAQHWAHAYAGGTSHKIHTNSG